MTNLGNNNHFGMGLNIGAIFERISKLFIQVSKSMANTIRL